jgi:hypothetical protein
MVFTLKALNIARPRAATKAPTTQTGFDLTRHFVLTGDERCPIAGIWSRLDTNTQPDQTDDPSLPQPVMEALPWRAIHPLFTPLHYLPA